jgi:uncharacterized pyridoxal phosphate-containing UPF0001 family protein
MNPVDGLLEVRAQIARACRDAGRDPATVTLVAVSKTHGAEVVEPVIAAGQRVFGENRVQEATAKWPALMARHGGLELHLVGTLQSNKAREAVTLFDAIHSVDRESKSPSKDASLYFLLRSIPARSRKRAACRRWKRMRFWPPAGTVTGSRFQG